MRKKICKKMMLFAALVIPFVLTACDGVTCGGDDFIPPAIALQITAINNMNVPVTVRMRHAYFGTWANNSQPYSGWITVQVNPGDSQILGNETANYRYKNKDETMNGFILLDRNIKNDFTSGDSSSFELEIETAANTMRLSGYETADPRFDAAGLGALGPRFELEGIYAEYFHESIESMIIAPYVIEANLTINVDGTFSFGYTNMTGTFIE
jgi:hypothetical protein